ncbi:MAG TPA: YARHG domain-containing protein [Cyclobacteriaceae bacterium]|nr:YARHG domain-containing protein [Cyclobacteriaceae bacterium]
MKQLLPLLFFGILLSCSKPGADSTSSTDSTAQGSVTSSNGEPITLTAEEMERVAFKIFIEFRGVQLYDGDPAITPYKEEFITNGNEFTYTLLRHNGSKAGWHDVEVQGEEGGSENDPYGEADPYGESGESDEPQQIYTNEIDTIEIKGRYMAFSDNQPESKLKYVKIVLTGKVRHMNYPYESYGEIKSYVDESDLASEISVELTTPMQLHRLDLYMKAKIADLTEQDLAGLSKDDLSIMRNEIFARHGHTFKTDKMIRYFGGKDWYHSLVDDAAPLLNKFEKRNVDFIKKLEG